MSINGDDTLDLEKLRETAKTASIYHRDRQGFVRNRNLSHVVHAGLHIFQSVRNHVTTFLRNIWQKYLKITQSFEQSQLNGYTTDMYI